MTNYLLVLACAVSSVSSLSSASPVLLTQERLSLAAEQLQSNGLPALQTELTTLEKQTWEAYKTKNVDQLKNLIASDFRAIYDQGTPGTRDSMLADVLKFNLTSYQLEELSLHSLSPDVAVLSYWLTYTGAEGKAPVQTKVLRASSTWVRRAGKWVNVYYQETVLPRKDRK